MVDLKGDHIVVVKQRVGLSKKYSFKKKNEFNILYLSGEENKKFKCIKTILVTTPQEIKLN